MIIAVGKINGLEHFCLNHMSMFGTFPVMERRDGYLANVGVLHWAINIYGAVNTGLGDLSP